MNSAELCDYVCCCGSELDGRHDHNTCGPPIPRCCLEFGSPCNVCRASMGLDLHPLTPDDIGLLNLVEEVLWHKEGF